MQQEIPTTDGVSNETLNLNEGANSQNGEGGSSDEKGNHQG